MLSRGYPPHEERIVEETFFSCTEPNGCLFLVVSPVVTENTFNVIIIA